MHRDIHENAPARRQENKKVAEGRADGRRRETADSREKWAEVLATADRYY